MECCRVDDALPECTVAGFSLGSVNPNVNWLHIRFDPLSQVEHGRPQGLLQWLGGRSDASITWWWSCWKSARATCPKKLSRLSWIRSETGQQPVVCPTVALVHNGTHLTRPFSWGQYTLGRSCYPKWLLETMHQFNDCLLLACKLSSLGRHSQLCTSGTHDPLTLDLVARRYL